MAISEEDYEKLSAPIPANKILTVDKGNGLMSYADVNYLEKRLREVDPNYEEHYTRSEDTLTCTLIVKGVPRAANAGLPPPPEKVGVRHTQTGLAESQAFRRACAKFTLGAELWPDKTVGRTPAAQPASRGSSPVRNSQSQSATGPTAAQRGFLTGALLVPDSVVDTLTGGKTGTASALISTLKPLLDGNRKEYEKKSPAFIRSALLKLEPEAVYDDEDLD